ncbi:MAG: metallophosphoesterase family protein [Solirubrobacteraceae bacterium]|nr:metallophosphoesterase family protein [Solirubrobacteraceae bacterium]
MRIAVISDTHMPKGDRVLPAECVERCSAADVILHGGDINDLATLDAIRALGPPVHAVWGNNCTDEVRAQIPKELVVELGGVQVGMIHIGGPAARRPERLEERFPGCGLVIFGHSHVPEHVITAAGTHVLNPGSPTERRRAPHCAMATVEISGGAVARVEIHPIV